MVSLTDGNSIRAVLAGKARRKTLSSDPCRARSDLLNRAWLMPVRCAQCSRSQTSGCDKPKSLTARERRRVRPTRTNAFGAGKRHPYGFRIRLTRNFAWHCRGTSTIFGKCCGRFQVKKAPWRLNDNGLRHICYLVRFSRFLNSSAPPKGATAPTSL